MSIIADQIRSTLGPQMTLPDELVALFAWIEEHGHFSNRNGTRTGWLHDEIQMRRTWTDTRREGGTLIEFFCAR